MTTAHTIANRSVAARAARCLCAALLALAAALPGAARADAVDGTAGDPPAARAEAAPEPAADAAPAARFDVVLDPGVVAFEMGRRRRGIADCYERALRHDPALAGSVELRFTVARDGTVRNVTLARDGLRSRSVRACVVALLDGARFPAPPRGAMSFSYPLHFRPAAESTPDPQ